MKKNNQGSEIIILDDSSNRPPYRADRFCWKPGDLVVTMPYISGKPYYRLYASPMAHFLDKKTYKYLGGFTDDERAKVRQGHPHQRKLQKTGPRSS